MTLHLYVRIVPNGCEDLIGYAEIEPGDLERLRTTVRNTHKAIVNIDRLHSARIFAPIPLTLLDYDRSFDELLGPRIRAAVLSVPLSADADEVGQLEMLTIYNDGDFVWDDPELPHDESVYFGPGHLNLIIGGWDKI